MLPCVSVMALLAAGDLWRFAVEHYSSMWTLMNLLMLAMSWGTIWFGVHRYDESTRLLMSMQAEGLAASQRAHAFLYHSMGCTQLLAGVVFVTWLRTFQYHRVTTQVRPEARAPHAPHARAPTPA